MKYGVLAKIPVTGDLKENCEKVFARIEKADLEACQLVYKPEKYRVEDAEIIKTSAAKHNVEISAQFLGYCDANCLWDEKFDFRLYGINSPLFGGDRIKYLISAIPFVKALGITDVIIHAGYVPNDPFDPQYANMVCAVRLFGQRLKSQGLNLLFETGQESPITLLRLIRDSGLDNLFVNLDTANFILYGYGNPVDAMYTLGHMVRNIHAKDGLPPTAPDHHGKETNLGEGFVDFPKVFKMLKERGYDRYMIMENELSENTDDIIENSIKYLKKLWNEVE